MNKIDTNKVKPFALYIIIIASLSGFLYGYDIGVIAGAFIHIRESLDLTTNQVSFIAGAVLGGGSIATLISGVLADKFGRRNVMIAGSLIFLIGVLVTVTALSYYNTLIGRLVQGIGIGIIFIVAPLYLAESIPAFIRGRAVTTFQLVLTAGILTAYLVDLGLQASQNWRAMFLCSSIPAIALFIFACFLTESPRWLYKKGKIDDVKKILKLSHSEEDMLLSMKEMAEQANIAKTKEKSANFIQLICQRRFFIPFILALTIACINQLTGINAFLQFSTLILKDAGIAQDQLSMLSTVGVGAINFIATLVAVTIIDRIGRKPLLIIGSAGVSIALIYTGIVEFLPPSLLKGILTMIGLFFFILFFAIGPGAVVFLAISELMPTAIRSKGMAICLFSNSLTSALLTFVFMPIVNIGGYQSIFWLCAACSICYCLIAIFNLPETKNKTLEEIETYFMKKTNSESKQSI